MASSRSKELSDLHRLFSSVRTEKEAEMLLTDMLTPGELRSLTKRWQELELLANGTKQREVSKKLKISISKVTRGSRVLRHGTGGAWVFFRRLGEKAKKRERRGERR